MHHPTPDNSSVPRPKATFLSLPKELHTIICAHLDKPSAIALLHVHRSLHGPVEMRLYEDAYLSLPKYWGESVLVQPYSRKHRSHRAWAEKKAIEFEHNGRAEARRHAELALRAFCRGDDRWSMLKSLVLEPRGGADVALAQFLAYATNVKRLDILANRDHLYKRLWAPEWYQCSFWSITQTLEPQPGQIYRHLTSLSVDFNAHDCPSAIIDLLILAPSLRELSLSGGHSLHQRLDEHELDCPGAEAARHPVQIAPRRLDVFICRLRAVSYDVNPPIVQHIIETLKPKTLSYFLDNRGCDWDDPSLITADALSKVTRLEYNPSLYIELQHIFGNTTFTSLTVLVLVDLAINSPAKKRLEVSMPLQRSLARDVNTDPQFTTLNIDASMPQLRVLLIKSIVGRPDPSQPRQPTCTIFDEDRQQTSLMSATVIADLAALPSLTTIQYVYSGDKANEIEVSDWSSQGVIGVVLREIQYKGQKLYHARSYSPSIVVDISEAKPVDSADGSDNSESESEATESDPGSTVSTLPRGEARTKVINADGTITRVRYGTSPRPQWQDSTHFQGLMVPLWVLSAMRRADPSANPWEGRNVQASDEAWKVLMDWKKKYHPLHTQKVPQPD